MDNKISEIFIPGPAGRLEAKYYKGKKNRALIIALVFKPNAYILIISLSLCSFKNDKINPNIITIGNITVIKLGIKNIDR